MTMPGFSLTPPAWQEDAAAILAANPRHLLFLCVGNSARSQMAEGIARALAPAGVRISSAGSAPKRIREEAVAALREIGIDISTQLAKGLDRVDLKTVDVVITLCAEEVCPFIGSKALQFHWPLSDPGAVEGSPLTQLAAFKAVRDELVKRLRHVFPG
jgi:protein-tyrosine-phosphatase